MNTNVIEGNPTKKFFIEMITRDISIEDAIVDLLDNSIDGANRINSAIYDGLWIKLTINDKEFSIEDNCGGFSLETAKKYAFRFGRPEDAPKMRNNTVGRFGIGMKRSLFKIGKNFSVESLCGSDHFLVDVNVEEWEKKTKTVTLPGEDTPTMIDDWSFNYHELDRSGALQNDGTLIKVTSLNPEVQDLFSDTRFISELAEDIQRLLNFSLLRGLQIYLNGIALEGKKVELLISDECMPYYDEGEVRDVKYKIVAGLGEIGEPKKSGWYIYCNDRLVVEADETTMTGWGLSSIPKWHVNHVMFRGILYLDSQETMNLPLTTTKKGIDTTSEIYKAILPRMKDAMINILDYLKKISLMGDQANSYRRMLCDTTERASAVELKSLSFAVNGEPLVHKNFISPPLDEDVIAQKKNTVRIAYDVNKSKANDAKHHAEASSYKELGSITFDYYLRMEDI